MIKTTAHAITLNNENNSKPTLTLDSKIPRQFNPYNGGTFPTQSHNQASTFRSFTL